MKRNFFYICIAIIIIAIAILCIAIISKNNNRSEVDNISSEPSSDINLTDVGSNEIIEEYENDPDTEDISIFQGNPSQETGVIDVILDGE